MPLPMDVVLRDSFFFRRFVWINHGCSFGALYGDDGEMQCGKCGKDFKAMDSDEILFQLHAILDHAGARATMVVTRELQTAEKQNRGLIQEANDIEQLVGKHLGYPWYKDDQKTFPGATEAQGVCVGDHTAFTIVSELINRRLQDALKIKG